MRPEVPPSWVPAAWPAPAHVYAVTTSRRGGVSTGPYAGLNLGLGSGDDPDHVAENRRRLAETLALPGEPRWLRQVHGTRVVEADNDEPQPEADACIARGPGQVCAVLTADCLPVLLADLEGTTVAAVHAGWRGLAGGVLEATLDAMAIPSGRVMAWLGPAIGPGVYEVGEEVRRAFVELDPGAGEAFRASREGRWLADLYWLGRRRLQARGLYGVFGGGLCTYTDTDRFYSYRRDGQSGRQATLIWLGVRS